MGLHGIMHPTNEGKKINLCNQYGLFQDKQQKMKIKFNGH